MIPLGTVASVWAVLVPLVDEVPDPADVKPGWLGFGVFLLLAAATVFLAFSFRKQLKRVDFEEEADGAASGRRDRNLLGPQDDEAGDGDDDPDEGSPRSH